MIQFKKDNVKDHYTMLEIIGEGGFGSVIKATHNETGDEVAIKMIKKDELDEEDLRNLHTEINVSAHVSHPNIVKMIDAYENKSNYFIVFELMVGGELFDRIVEKECYTEKEAANVFRPIVDAIRYCHNNGIVHRDLKPENLLYLEEDPESTIKVSDFGLARVLDNSNALMSTVCGTPAYLAPEIIKNEKYGPSCDCWSLGIILYVLLCGYPPFGDEANEEMFTKIKNGELAFPSPEWDGISEDAKDLIKSLIQIDANQRLTTEQILNHPWMAVETNSEINGIKQRLRKYNARRKLLRAQRAVYFSQLLKGKIKK